MKTPAAAQTVRRQETGFRMPEDQMRNLDFLVGLTQGRKKRSHLIMEALDEYIAARMNRLAPVVRS